MKYLSIFSLLCFINFSFTKSQYNQPFAPYYSQNGQDKFLVEKVFKHKKNGIFFDIGAHDGISYSNTYYFEKYLNWTGVCVEPQDENFKELRRNRSSVCIHGGIFDSEGELEFFKVHGPSEMLSGLVQTYDPRHLERARKEVEKLGGRIEIVKIKTYLFNEICKQNNITHIDLLSVDTEGCEVNIIKSIDLDATDIFVIVVENNYREKELEKYLSTKNYRLYSTISGDDIYIKNNVAL